MFKSGVGAVSGLLVLILLGIVGVGAAVAQQGEAELFLADEGAVSDSYIVVLKAEPEANDAALVRRQSVETFEAGGAEIVDTYERAVNGMLVTATAAQLELIRQDSRVDYVTQNASITLELPEDVSANADPALRWGLDRVNQRSLPLDGNIGFAQAGSGVDIYIVDSGINAGHQDFGGRVAGGFNAFDPASPGDWGDCNGHGTHVAGTAAGSTWGLATAANLYAVKVFGECSGSGTIGGLLIGIDWIIGAADGPSVANMSLGASASQTLVTTATENLIESGVSVVAAAGNFSLPACGDTPAVVSGALTVAASNIADGQAWFSNVGPCVDLYAPGVDIWSASAFENAGSRMESGTSMSAPHVAGAVALYLGQNPGASPAQVHDAIVSASTSGVLSGVSADTPNKLLFASGGGDVGGGDVVKVRARGTTGEETIVLELDGSQAVRFDLSTQFAEYTFSGVSGRPGSLRVLFDNDGQSSSGADKNVLVDFVEVDGERFESEAPTVESLGSYDGTSCDQGFKQSEWLQCNGWFAYDLGDGGGGGGGGDGVAVNVRARGTTGEETVNLEVNGSVVETFNLSQSLQVLSHNFSGGAVESLRVVFDNDGSSSLGADKNVNVDYVEVDGQRIETEDPSTLSLGSWNGSCGEGYKQSEWLHCNGWFAYDVDGSGGGGGGGGGDDGVLLNLRARGTTGSESIKLEVNGSVVEMYALGRDFEELPYNYTDGAVNSVRILFDNNGTTIEGEDKNVIIDYMEVDGTRYESEDPSTESLGSYDGTSCDQGFKQSEWLHCNGWFDYDVDSSGGGGGGGESIMVNMRARGTTGTESIKLEVNGAVVESYALGSDFQATSYLHTDGAINSVRVLFDNNGTTADGEDKNVIVDYVDVNSVRYESEAPSVESLGSYDGSSCGQGFKQSEWLHCNGWFDYNLD